MSCYKKMLYKMASGKKLSGKEATFEIYILILKSCHEAYINGGGSSSLDRETLYARAKINEYCKVCTEDTLSFKLKQVYNKIKRAILC